MKKNILILSLTSSLSFAQIYTPAGKISGAITNEATGNVGIGTQNPQSRLEVSDGFVTSKIDNGSIDPKNKAGYRINELGLDVFEISYARDYSGILKMKTLLDNPISFGTNNKESMRIDPNGNVGIGTMKPIAKLQIESETSSPDGEYNSLLISSNNESRLKFGNSDEFSWIQSEGTKALSINPNGSDIILNEKDGSVGIGSVTPDEKLTVKGKIHAEEVRVDLNIPADYVFEKYYTGNSDLKSDYKMPTLAEVEQYTKENNHLPSIPSAKEIKEKGLQVGEMTNLLLQKIEELTLYTIEQQKRIEALEKQIKQSK